MENKKSMSQYYKQKIYPTMCPTNNNVRAS